MADNNCPFCGGKVKISQKGLVFAKHDNCDKEFIFAVPCNFEIHKGDILLVNTMYGEDIAKATSEIIEGQDLDEVAMRFGAYLPLKEVKQVVGKRLQDYIAGKEKINIICQIQDGDTTLPF